MGDCHFLEGNLRAKERVAHAKEILDEIGMDGRRLEMYHIGASDAPNWAKAVREMTERARELGRNPIRRRVLEMAQRGQAPAAGEISPALT
jgi:F420-non-reducing hydrogenase iron-sulfur subunit